MTTLIDELRRVAEARPRSPALSSPSGEVFRYSDLCGAIDAISVQLTDAGVPVGARVAMCLRDGIDAALLALAVPLRHVLVPLDPRCPPAELERQLREVRPCALLVASGHWLEASSFLPVFRVDCGLASGALELYARNALRPEAHHEQEPGASREAALLIGTSGTAGRPSFAELTHTNALASVANVIRGYALDLDDVRLNVMPLFHVQGLIGGLWAPLLAGGAVLQTAGFDARRVLSAIETGTVSWFSAVPTMHRELLRELAWREGPVTHRLRFVRVGSDALDPKLREELRVAWGVPVVGSYGMTEASSQITVQAFVDNPDTSCGRVLGPEVRITGVDGEPLLDGCVGEVWIRGANVVARYVNGRHPERWSADGWFRTGDLGRFDDAGFLYLQGRTRDQIRTGGEAVTPAHVEAVLEDFPDVAEAAVAGIPHPRLGQQVAALVVLRQGRELDLDALLGFAATRLSPHQLPGRVLAVERLPRGPTGKLRRREATEVLSQTESRDRGPVSRAPNEVPTRAIAAIWCSVLGVPEARAGDDFFELGGASLALETLLARIEEETLHSCTLAEAMARPTFSGLISVLRANPSAALLEIQAARSGPVLWCLPPAIGSLVGFAHLAPHLAWPGPIRGARQGMVAGPLASDAPGGGIRGTAERMLQRIDEVDGDSRPYLLGYSLGGLVAFEIARLLEERGRPARFVGLIDSQIPSRGSKHGMWKHFSRLNEIVSRADIDGPPGSSQEERMWRELDRYFDRITVLGGDRTGTARQRTLRMLGLGSDASERDPEAGRWVLRAFRVAFRHAGEYMPEPILTGVDFFRAGKLPPGSDPSLGWADVAPCRIHALSGNHMEVLAVKRASATASVLSPVLASALRRG